MGDLPTHPLAVPNASEMQEASRALAVDKQPRPSTTRSMLGWIIVLSFFVVVFVVFNPGNKKDQRSSRPGRAAEPLVQFDSRHPADMALGAGVVLCIGGLVGLIICTHVFAPSRGAAMKTQRQGWREDGIFLQDGDVEAGDKWNCFLGYIETPQVFILLTDPAHGRVLPKRGLAPDEVSLLQAAIARHLPREGGART